VYDVTLDTADAGENTPRTTEHNTYKNWTHGASASSLSLKIKIILHIVIINCQNFFLFTPRCFIFAVWTTIQINSHSAWSACTATPYCSAKAAYVGTQNIKQNAKTFVLNAAAAETFLLKSLPWPFTSTSQG